MDLFKPLDHLSLCYDELEKRGTEEGAGQWNRDTHQCLLPLTSYIGIKVCLCLCLIKKEEEQHRRVG